MSFIGIVVENKEFEYIKNLLYKNIKNKVNLIKISEKSIENIKNVKCETIVICKKISEFKEEKKEILKQIINNAKHLIINADIEMEKDFFSNIRIKIINYGLNQKATLTVSSIGEENVMLCLQRNIETIDKNIIEPYEVNIKIKEMSNKKLYNFLTIYAILTLYNIKQIK